MNILVILGDLVAIALFLFFSGFGVPYHDQTTAISPLVGLTINILPYLLLWGLAWHHPKAREINAESKYFPWKLLLLGWSITGLFSGVLDHLLIRHLFRTYTRRRPPLLFPSSKSS
jgi:hypothetical protein